MYDVNCVWWWEWRTLAFHVLLWFSELRKGSKIKMRECDSNLAAWNVCVCVCIYLVVVYRVWATIVWSCLRIYICLVFPLVDVHSLPLSPLLSVHSKYLYFFRENYFFVSFKQISLCSIFLCPLKFLASPFLNIRSFLSVSSRLFINVYIVIKSPLSLLSFNVVNP